MRIRRVVKTSCNYMTLVTTFSAAFSQRRPLCSFFSCSFRRTVQMQTLKMTLSIVGVFIVCWTPYFVVHLVDIWSEYKHSIPQAVVAFADTAALVNSAVNPVLYAIFTVRSAPSTTTAASRRRNQPRDALIAVQAARAAAAAAAAAAGAAAGGGDGTARLKKTIGQQRDCGGAANTNGKPRKQVGLKIVCKSVRHIDDVWYASLTAQLDDRFIVLINESLFSFIIPVKSLFSFQLKNTF
jgi:hypothetical protein